MSYSIKVYNLQSLFQKVCNIFQLLFSSLAVGDFSPLIYLSKYGMILAKSFYGFRNFFISHNNHLQVNQQVSYYVHLRVSNLLDFCTYSLKLAQWKSRLSRGTEHPLNWCGERSH